MNLHGGQVGGEPLHLTTPGYRYDSYGDLSRKKRMLLVIGRVTCICPLVIAGVFVTVNQFVVVKFAICSKLKTVAFVGHERIATVLVAVFTGPLIGTTLVEIPIVNQGICQV